MSHDRTLTSTEEDEEEEMAPAEAVTEVEKETLVLGEEVEGKSERMI